MDDRATETADAVLANLDDRSGIGDVLGSIRSGDPSTWAELRETLADIIRAHMGEPKHGVIEEV